MFAAAASKIGTTDDLALIRVLSAAVRACVDAGVAIPNKGSALKPSAAAELLKFCADAVWNGLLSPGESSDIIKFFSARISASRSASAAARISEGTAALTASSETEISV